MDLFIVLLASMASMVASLVWLRLTTEQRTDGKRGDGLTHKIREERADGLTHKSCEERADGLTIKIDGERAERWTHKIRGERADGLTHKSCEERVDGLILKMSGVRVQRLTRNNNNNISEERADGLTHWLVDGDGSESGGFRWAKTRTTSCLRRTQRKIKSLSALDCV